MKLKELRRLIESRIPTRRRRRRRDPVGAGPIEFDPAVAQTIERVQPYTQTSPLRIEALCNAVTYIVRHQLQGAIVECGVWRGGSMMAVAETLLRLGEQDRPLYLFDTFEGMTSPSQHDIDFEGKSASDLLHAQDREDPLSVWCVSPMDEVRQNMQSTGYPSNQVHFVRGKVEQTLPDEAPPRIAILRLDTDWYASTRHEMEHLFPRLVPGGVLIIDDYGHWNGARRAVDEYFQMHGIPMLLQRIDYSGRISVVCPQAKRTAA